MEAGNGIKNHVRKKGKKLKKDDPNYELEFDHEVLLKKKYPHGLRKGIGLTTYFL